MSILREYLQAMKATKPETVLVPKKDKKFAAGPPEYFIFPPFNTDIRIENLSKKVTPPRRFSAVEIPEIWDWVHSYPVDTQKEKEIKERKLITPPQSQLKCGSCYAFALSTVTSDLFVVSGKVQNNPNISPSSILSCYTDNPENPCGGGQPSEIVDTLSKNNLPLYSNHCMDYSWCVDNELCSSGKGGGREFNNKETIPVPKCGCYENPTNKLGYTVSEAYRNTKDVKDSENRKGLSDVDTIKYEIRTIGPKVGCFLVLKNMKTKNVKNPFQATENIYLENWNYDDGKLDPYDQSLKTVLGGHAISVLGWGLSKEEIAYDIVEGNVQKARIPYWFCRNSWGPDWGENGYFKIAMYPFNKKSQLDNSNEGLGGMFSFAADSIVDSNGFKNNNFSGKMIQDKNFYESDVNIKDFQKKEQKKLEKEPVKPEEVPSNKLYISLSISLVIILVFTIYYIFSKKQKVQITNVPLKFRMKDIIRHF